MRKWGHSRLYIVQMPYTHGRNDNQAFQPVQPTTCYGRPSWDTDSVPGTPESILPRMRTPALSPVFFLGVDLDFNAASISRIGGCTGNRLPIF
mgnify:CR=1 FL=1